MLPPDLTWKRALHRLRKGGIAWLAARVGHEWRTPTTRPGKVLFRWRVAALSAVKAPWRAVVSSLAGVPGADGVLYAFCDLSVAPVTYDVIWVIVGAEVKRRALGLNGVHFVVVPGPNDGLRTESREYERAVDADARRQRLMDLMLPAFSLLPSTQGISMVGSRAEAEFLRARAAHVFPPGYEVAAPRFPHPSELIAAAAAGAVCQVLTAPAGARRMIRHWLDGVAGERRVVTITLRSYGFGEGRNSDVEAWAAFARGLDPVRWCVVFLVDTARTFDPLPAELDGFPTLHQASWNLPLRCALYEEAWANLGVNSGPLLLTCFSQARGIMFRMVNEDVAQTTTAYMRSLGFEPGQCPPVAHRFHRWVWERESAGLIRREFDRLTADIEADVCG